MPATTSPTRRRATMKHATVLTARLRESERAALESHFLALDGGDRRLRFGLPLADEGSETDARLALDPPTAQSLFTEWLHDHHANAIHVVRQHARFSRALIGFFAPAR